MFAGPVTATDVNGVLGRDDAADDVRELAERSLVTVDLTATPTRFSLLHIVRMHAADRLRASGRADELAERHARWFLSVVRDADAQLRTPDEPRGAQRIESVFGELRAAQLWARTRDPELAAALCAHLHLYAHSRLVDEPLQWAEDLCANLDPDNPWLPVLVASAATRAINRGELLHDVDPTAAFAHLDRAVEQARLAGSRFLEGVALVSACSLRARVGDVDVAFRSFRDTIAHWDRLAELTHQRTTLRNLVVLFQRAGDAGATAELLGSVRSDAVAVFAGEAQRLDAAHDWAVQQLGAERFEERFARGRARDLASAAAWTLATITDRLDARQDGEGVDQGSGVPSRDSSTTSGTSRPNPDARS